MSQSTYWGPAMSDSQYAVFRFDVKSMVMAEGGPRIFDTLADAERYCQENITSNTSLGCRILDHTGKTVRTFSDDQVYDKHHGRPAAKRNVWVGSALLIAGVSSVALDAWLGWRLVFGVLLGVRLLWAGCVKTIDGVAFLMRSRNAFTHEP
jgi:hypothetical protein